MARHKNSFEIFGFDELAQQFANIGKAAEPAAKRAIYVGAGIMAEAIKGNIKKIPKDSFGHNKYQQGVSDTQRELLLDSLGISKFGEKKGIINVRVGFHGSGYMSGGKATRTKKYPDGLPAPLLANAVESGSEWRAKHGFVRKAINANKAKVIKAMSDEFDKEIKKVIGGK